MADNTYPVSLPGNQVQSAQCLGLTGYQVMAILRKRYYLAFSVGSEQIVSVDLDESAGVLKVATVRARLRDSRSCQTVTHHGARFITVSLETYKPVTDETVWVKLPEPIRLAVWTVKNTPARMAQDRLAYMTCFRPGAQSWTGGSSARMGHRDSYARTLQASS